MKKFYLIIISCILIFIGTIVGFYIANNKTENSIEETVVNIQCADNASTTEILELTQEEYDNIEEQLVEGESFELQGEIAYEGDKAKSWNVELGDYAGLTYYSQIDSRWKNHIYSSIGDSAQTIGNSGCGPTCAAMIVSSIKGTITPDIMGDLFVKHGYRSSRSGTYWSGFRAIADEFDIEYKEVSNLDTVEYLLKNNNYIVAICGNGLFTNGGHFIVIYGIDGDLLKIYDPCLYSGKFTTSTRRGKVTVSGNTVYCSIENFKKYANYKGFFCYKYNPNLVKLENSTDDKVETKSYINYVSAKSGLNVRTGPSTSYKKIKTLTYQTKVTVYETDGNWSRIGENEWVCNTYLSSNKVSVSIQKKVNAKIGLVLRKNPTTKAKKILTIPYGKKVTIITGNAGTASGYKWSKVKYGNYEGYVASKYLK